MLKGIVHSNILTGYVFVVRDQVKFAVQKQWSLPDGTLALDIGIIFSYNMTLLTLVQGEGWCS